EAVRTQTQRADVLQGLGWLGESFDLIFSGAPYRDEKKRPLFFVERLLGLIREEGVLNPDGIFLAQHSIKETFQVPPEWELRRQERYGDTVVSFFKYARKT